ncbi:hypothetical protein [Paenibacillus apiarius]|nr:hypothetical protein [Paenibacillus apiarius]MEC0122901.1 hypothetical protein [Paenibacillus apiarius]MEC0194612.1 hypothetical protein [Paenibacillus apiarius]
MPMDSDGGADTYGWIGERVKDAAEPLRNDYGRIRLAEKTR